MCVNLRSWKIRKIPSSVYINYYTCKYTIMVQNDEFLTFKFVFINEGESNRKLPNQIESC